jgi:cytochrome c oxidase subunit 3
MAEAHHGNYYLPDPSRWPITGSVGLFTLAFGAAVMLNGSHFGTLLMGVGLAIIVYMIWGWFSVVIGESERGVYSDKVDVSFRWGMIWFIFSEVMFFSAFFGALFYARIYAVPWLGGEGAGYATHEFLWPDFEAIWPLLSLPDPEHHTPAQGVVPWDEVPLLNTIILVSSGGTVTLAHWGLNKGDRKALIGWLLATVTLGVTFLGFQVSEFGHAWTELDLTLNSGIYGATFYMLTGFHGAHVTLGAIMLTVILGRSIRGHFKPTHHFAFEAVAWYWHFVDVVWIGLFIFVYTL